MLIPLMAMSQVEEVFECTACNGSLLDYAVCCFADAVCSTGRQKKAVFLLFGLLKTGPGRQAWQWVQGRQAGGQGSKGGCGKQVTATKLCQFIRHRW